jgi:hypothetical protein
MGGFKLLSQQGYSAEVEQARASRIFILICAVESL